MQTSSHLSVLVQKRAAQYGDREALVYKDFDGDRWKSCSWNRFAATVKTVSNALLNLGVQVQENVGVFSQNCKEYLFCDYGAWGIRAVTIPFYATCSEQQIEFMINDAKVRVLFVGEQEQYDKAHRVRALCPTLERIVVFDRTVSLNADDRNSLYFEDFLKMGEGLPRQSEVNLRYKEANSTDLANILYTSGTTGNSKGVMLTHGQYMAALDANLKCVRVSEKDRILNFLPFAHIFEKAWAVLGVTVGATLIVNTDPREVQKSMRETHPTSMCAVPRFWEKVLIGVEQKMEGYSSVMRRVFRNALAIGRRYNVECLSRGKKPSPLLRMQYEMVNKTIFSLIRKELGLENANIFPTAGATVSPHVEEFVHSIGLDMVVGYGLTESLATVSCDHLDKAYSIGSVGRLIEGIELKISEEGEVLLKGPTITPGYYNREDLTAAAFDEEGFFRTGDAGYMKNGELYLTDRIKDLFKTSNGKYIAPQMIESKLLVDRYIDQIAIIADERKFVSALIVPDYALLEEYARTQGISFEHRGQLCADERIYRMMMDRIATIQQQLAHYEQVKRFTLLPRPFTMADGELTNTLKLKRQVICRNFSDEIEKMYEE